MDLLHRSIGVDGVGGATLCAARRSQCVTVVIGCQVTAELRLTVPLDCFHPRLIERSDQRIGRTRQFVGNDDARETGNRKRQQYSSDDYNRHQLDQSEAELGIATSEESAKLLCLHAPPSPPFMKSVRPDLKKSTTRMSLPCSPRSSRSKFQQVERWDYSDERSKQVTETAFLRSRWRESVDRCRQQCCRRPGRPGQLLEH